MRKLARFGVLFGAGLGFAISLPAKAALVLYYNFDSKPLGALADGSTIINQAGGANGIFSIGTDAGGSANIVASGAGAGSGNALQLNPAGDGSNNVGAPNINTTLTAAALGVTPGTAYTAMAWVKFGSTTGDNMIFGQDGTNAANGGAVLHLGTRNGNLHSGHWGDDIGPDQGVNVQPGTDGWHHVAYTNDGAAGNQSIYLDGALVVGPGAAGTAGAMDTAQLLRIGTSNNSGSFSGMLDEVKIFNTQLSVTEIQAAMAVPEPTTMTAVIVGGLGLLMTRRRRADH